MDPGGIVPKVRHVVRSREDITREQVKSLFSNISDLERTKVKTIIELKYSPVDELIASDLVNYLPLSLQKNSKYVDGIASGIF